MVSSPYSDLLSMETEAGKEGSSLFMDVAIALGGGAASGGTLPIVTGFSWLLWIEDSAGGGGKARRRKRGHALRKE